MLDSSHMVDLPSIARTLMTSGKGILAADESIKSADKRLAEYGIAPSEEMRRKYRDLFLAAPGAEQYVSGVILYEETLTQSADDGTPFAELLASRGVIPGIKVDTGTEPFPESANELITNGLLGLSERLTEFKQKYGTGFTKWRAVVRIEGDALPTSRALVENAKRLAEYAYLVQQAGMVPILEPEVLLEGSHSRMKSRDVLIETMEALMAALQDRAVDFGSVLVKTSMALSGSKSGRTDTPEEVAEDTIAALIQTIPSAVPGIVFLSGGQTADQATENLRAICEKARDVHAPWPLTYSYARALQDEALKVWGGNDENVPLAREAYLARLQKVSEALG